MLVTHQLDLNLLLSLHALLTHGSVTRAAETLGVTQSAMSRSLGRLREAFDDPLFVRAANKLAPTPRAEALREPLTTILRQIDQLVVPEDFCPATARARYRIACSGSAEHALLPAVLGTLLYEAPQFELEIVPWEAHILEAMSDDGPDLALGLAFDAPADVYQRVVCRDRVMCALRANHPALRDGELSLDAYCATSQLQLRLGQELGQMVDNRLATLGRERRVKLQLSQYAAAFDLVSESDLLLTAPELVLRAAGRRGLKVVPLPFDLPQVTLSLYWHARRHHDPAHIWLRNALCDGLKAEFEARRDAWAVDDLSRLQSLPQMRPLPVEKYARPQEEPRCYPRLTSFYPVYR
ncbi:LysR family transcriptional regulator [Chitiniphilus shinanonensis]|uniref:LysR family transcriptional regulator n=1 Tax=Chitiniphilus shinanonensis TaxID=553088 RepID=A0ABQ6BQS7_9NEIS|nr:LysR family transcriptional regulator [Chitiniphilus shinanonensis]GLS04176.1 LysR family transcriptional regulator [Chitiniphilus shinanonensis]